MGSTSSLCHLLAQPDPRSDVGEHHRHAEEGARGGEDEGARFTRLTMRVAEMIKLQSDAKRGMYTCLECGRGKNSGKNSNSLIGRQFQSGMKLDLSPPSASHTLVISWMWGQSDTYCFSRICPDQLYKEQNQIQPLKCLIIF